MGRCINVIVHDDVRRFPSEVPQGDRGRTTGLGAARTAWALRERAGRRRAWHD